MIRLHMVVEGQTEEAFVKTILVNHLGEFGISTDVRCVETSRTRSRIHRGGSIDYGRAKRDLLRWMSQDDAPDSYFTTMFDLFRLPKDFPEYEKFKSVSDPYERVERLEGAFGEDLNHARFIPYIQLHEFEALILSDPSRFGIEFINRDQEVRRLVELCSKYESPERIDDGQETAPSKRILEILPEYVGKKVSAGPRIAGAIGLDNIRKKCPHFDAWLGKIGKLGRTP